MLRNIEISAKL